MEKMTVVASLTDVRVGSSSRVRPKPAHKTAKITKVKVLAVSLVFFDQCH